jgi:serine/threonine protein kinase
MAPEIASEKLGRYEILSELGHGAMGVVYKAIDPLIDRIVAIKTIKFDLSSDDSADFEERFYREAKSAGRLNHPNIVTIYDVGKSENIAYIAMEFLEGQLLKDVLDVHTAMSIDKIVDIAAQIAEGLAYAHKNGIVHRDIKPSNIMLVYGDTIRITDFGIARMSTSSKTIAGTVMGSPRYMAPEQVVGKAIDGRSDLFSLGVVLYELLTGESPFDADNINTTMYRIVNEVPTPPKTLNPRLPEVFDYIVAKALAKDLSINPSATAALNHPITLDRKLKPRSSIGEATLPLTPTIGATPLPKKPASNTKTLTTKTTNTQTVVLHKGFFQGWNKKILITASMILLLAFTSFLMRSEPAKKLNKAVQPTAMTAPQPVVPIKPRESVSLAEGEVLNAKSPEIEPLAPPPGVDPKPTVEPVPVPPANVISSPSVTPSQEIAPAVTRASPSVSTGSAQLSFAVTPWGDVYLDGKKVGPSPPLKDIKVSAGKHKIEIRNLNFTSYSETVNIKAKSTKRIKHIFK